MNTDKSGILTACSSRVWGQIWSVLALEETIRPYLHVFDLYRSPSISFQLTLRTKERSCNVWIQSPFLVGAMNNHKRYIDMEIHPYYVDLFVLGVLGSTICPTGTCS